MTQAAAHPATPEAPIPGDRIAACDEAIEAARGLAGRARKSVSAMVTRGGKIEAGLLESRQFAAHGLAWLETYVAALAETLAWAKRLKDAGTLSELEQLILQSAFAEYLAQMEGGIAMSQVEIVRPGDLGLSESDVAAFRTPAVVRLMTQGNTPEARARIAALVAHGHYGRLGLEDETLELVREQMRRFVEDQVIPHAHEWHLRDELIPIDIITQMAELGVFGLAVPEEFGGLGMGKIAMCVVTEELSRGFLGVGSLGTRAEIAAELIRLGGTDEQKRAWLPKIASGEVLTTAVFTEPNTGSDLGSLTTRAIRDGDLYRVTGAKTWITHGARSDLMTLLARTDPGQPGYKGLSMFLAEKPRGTDSDPFPAKGMSGGEIEVLGYRGMKEYEIAFDGFEIPAGNLLGGVEGQGFKQLMATFESARIQTAARAVGVAQAALEIGLKYAEERVQVGKTI